ncbi:hypothetical protein PINS_up015399 [Pythium insidiosum]|nr:hypothetical protein PINS_up015399 [Pythium insidiosum]
MAGLQDRAKPVSFEAAMTTVESELQRPWQKVFPTIDRAPLAAASLAQVHEAVDCYGRRVAVKVQYPHLQAQMKTDLAVIRLAFRAIEYFFPNVQIEWIYPEFESALRSELSFEHEKHNNRRIAALLRHNESVHVPEVYDELSSEKLLTMEFIDAPKISDVAAIEAQGLDPREVARVLCEAFGEMVFCHGFVHCDPHPGNIFATRKTQLVLLDHGLYRELDDGFRRTYCDLWRAMLVRDYALVEDCGRRLNAGEFAAFLPLLFTHSPLAKSLNEDERQALIQDLKRLQFSDVTDFLQQLPRDMLFVFRTNNMIRSLNKDLGGSTRDRFATMGKYAVAGHALDHSSAASVSLRSRVRYWWEHLSLVFHLHVVDWALRGYYRTRSTSRTRTRTRSSRSFNGDDSKMYFGVFDGHGTTGDLCSTFAKKECPERLIKILEKKYCSFLEAYSKSFEDTNAKLHASRIDDSLSGTTAICLFLDGETIHVANVGDSRAVIATMSEGKLTAQPLSVDQTPYPLGADERERVRRCGARVLTMDQLEGIAPIHDNWAANLNDQVDEDGDPPRIWSPYGRVSGHGVHAEHRRRDRGRRWA